jgi:hypothetical protein
MSWSLELRKVSFFPGWDGLVTAPRGSTFVPAGVSRWELSTSEHVQATAQANYRKRTDEPLGAIPAASSFIFVTPRRWTEEGGKDRWVEARKSEAVWRDVRVYDADNLGTWLEQAPPVHIWLSRQLGKHPPDAVDLETYWDDWSGVTSPPFNVPLVIAGRQAEASRVLEWIAETPQLISLQAETEEEAIAFLAAAMQGLPEDDRDRLLSRSVVVTSEQSWRQVSFAAAPAVLVPQLPDNSPAPAAVGRGHHVLVPFARNHPTDQTTIFVASDRS